MIKAFKGLVAAAALALTPMAAAAVTLTPNGTTDILLGNEYDFQQTVSGPSGAGSTEFTLDATQPTQLALASQFVTLEFTGAFQDLTITLETLLGTVSATALTTPSATVRFFTLDTVFNKINGYTQTLTVAWSGVTGSAAQYNIQATPSQVPLPAGGLLLLTAVGGAFALRRHRKAAIAA